MKYLKPFYENTGRSQEELDLCEGSLAYLLDDGFVVDVEYIIKNNIKYIKIYKPNYSGGPTYGGPTYKFSWDEIKDYFIPFFQRLLSTEDLYSNMNLPYSMVMTTGIMFKYIKPKHIHHAKANATWYEHHSEQETKMFQPTPEQIINDEILDEPNTIYSTAKCMNYIYEITLVMKL